MFKIKAYLNKKLVLDQSIPHLPRIGDTVCFGSRNTIVAEVIWSLDKDEQDGKNARVTLALEDKNT